MLYTSKTFTISLTIAERHASIPYIDNSEYLETSSKLNPSNYME